MTQRLAHDSWLYHKTEAPDGKLFKADEEHPGHGWLDNPTSYKAPEPTKEAPPVPDLVYDDEAKDSTPRLEHDTWLYHPKAGSRLFTKGEPVPKAPWSDSPGGEAFAKHKPPKDHDAHKGHKGHGGHKADDEHKESARVEQAAGEAGAHPDEPLAPEPEPESERVGIPADWETLPWFSLAKLAKDISGDKPENKAAASKVIEAELARRA